MKVIWQNRFGTCMQYDLATHSRYVYKFLYWFNSGDEIILAGEHHGDEIFTHQHLRRSAGELVPAENPDGIGLVSFEGIIEWESPVYKIVTPEKIRSRIAEALNLTDACRVLTSNIKR